MVLTTIFSQKPMGKMMFLHVFTVNIWVISYSFPENLHFRLLRMDGWKTIHSFWEFAYVQWLLLLRYQPKIAFCWVVPLFGGNVRFRGFHRIDNHVETRNC